MQESRRKRSVVLVGVFLSACPAMTVSASDIDDYPAYLVSDKNISPDSVTPDKLESLMLIDLEYGFAAKRNGTEILEKAEGSHRYHPEKDSNIVLELFMDEGGYALKMTSKASGESARFSMYPMKRLGREYYKNERIGKREMFYWVGQDITPDFTLCDTGFAITDDGFVMTTHDRRDQVVETLSVTQQGDVMVFTPLQAEEKYNETLFEMDYQLADYPETRFIVGLPGVNPDASALKDAVLDQIYPCEKTARGGYSLVEPFDAWFRSHLAEARQE